MTRLRILAGAVLAVASLAASLAHAGSVMPSATVNGGRATQVYPNAPCIAPAASAAGNCTFVAPDYGLPVVQTLSQQMAQSADTPITGNGCTPAFIPAKSAFNVTAYVTGGASFTATVQLYKSFDGGTTKVPIVVGAGGSQTVMDTWTSGPFTGSESEQEYNVSWYACVTNYGGTAFHIRFSH